MRLATREDIDRILKDEDLWDRARGSANISRDEFEPPSNWLYMTETGKDLLVLDNKSFVHPNFLPEVRHKAYFIIKKWLKLLQESGFKVLKAKIPKKYKNTIRMAELLGFEMFHEENNKVFFILRCE